MTGLRADIFLDIVFTGHVDVETRERHFVFIAVDGATTFVLAFANGPMFE